MAEPEPPTATRNSYRQYLGKLEPHDAHAPRFDGENISEFLDEYDFEADRVDWPQEFRKKSCRTSARRSIKRSSESYQATMERRPTNSTKMSFESCTRGRTSFGSGNPSIHRKLREGGAAKATHCPDCRILPELRDLLCGCRDPRTGRES
ncbi:hypothetical protein P3342_005003 [Pyrenophora teres f. teres]|nr:hypothetical protein P3342_005003 [Pyrenophora teres f. teres]